MKIKIILSVIMLGCFSAFAQDNPYEIYGHKSNVVYETRVSDNLYIKNKDTTSLTKALAFKIMDGVILILGKNDSILNTVKMRPEQLLHWFSVDPHANKYPGMSPYSFVGDMPIRAVDPDGKDIYILFYTSGNKRGDEMFKASALTRQANIERSKGFNPNKDKVVVIEVQDMASIQKNVTDVVKNLSPKYGQTQEFSLWSHAGQHDGPTGSANTSADAVDGKQMSKAGWGKINFNWKNNGVGAKANFFGCNTGANYNETTNYTYNTQNGSLAVDYSSKTTSFAKEISSLSNFANVNVAGQTSSAFPSMYTNYRQNAENSSGGFMDGEKNGWIHFQTTYMVGGQSSYGGFNSSNSQHVANPMQNNTNGQTTGTSYQEGTIK